jgi:hypothetical protein
MSIEQNRTKKGPEENSTEDTKLTRRQMFGILGGATVAATGVVGGMTMVGLETKDKYEKRQQIDKEHTEIRKASVLEKGEEGGNGSAAEGFVQGAHVGSMMGPGAAIQFGVNGAIRGSYENEKRYWVKFKIDNINDADATHAQYVSKEQYEKWNAGDQIDVTVVTDENDPSKLRKVQVGN